jgi:hypothetical protein
MISAAVRVRVRLCVGAAGDGEHAVGQKRGEKGTFNVYRVRMGVVRRLCYGHAPVAPEHLGLSEGKTKHEAMYIIK